jgi:hypothetical protein
VGDLSQDHSCIGLWLNHSSGELKSRQYFTKRTSLAQYLAALEILHIVKMNIPDEILTVSYDTGPDDHNDIWRIPDLTTQSSRYIYIELKILGHKMPPNSLRSRMLFMFQTRAVTSPKPTILYNHGRQYLRNLCDWSTPS